jgi:nanoRNase/pAp phosphatase (c-di-AMP/oligoRNAs hydrolase)
MHAIDFAELKRILGSHKSVRTIITFHSIGDTDSVASAFSLAEYFSNSTIVTPDFITSNSKHILDRLGFPPGTIKNTFDESAEFIVMVDVNNFDDCGAFKDRLARASQEILAMDHHISQSIDKDSFFSFNDEAYNSTSSIVFDLLKSLGFKIDSKTAELLASGIVSDSAEFRNSTPSTFVQIGELLRIANKDYQTLLLDMRHTAAPENRQDAIKSLFNSEVMIRKNLVFVIGKGFRANIAADDAIRVGADVALFHSISSSEISFSARLRPLLDKERSIHLGKVMAALAPIIKGHGGGHPCAAGAYGSEAGAAQEFINSFVNAVLNSKSESSQ